MTTVDSVEIGSLRFIRPTGRSTLAVWATKNRWWLSLFAFYLATAALLVFGFGVIMTDSISRVANSSYVVRGREPHLAALGFVWTPGPSLMTIPLLPFAKVFPQLLTAGFASNITSAFTMTAAVKQLHRIVKHIGVNGKLAALVTATFAFNPVVVFYAANGMSEALSTFGLLLALAALLSWLRDAMTVQLVVCGMGVGIAYLARYEAGIAFPGIALIVALVSYTRARRGFVPPMSAMRLSRPGTTSAGGAGPGWVVLTEMMLLSIPAATAFLGWAAISFVVTGHPFEQLSSEYGIREFVRVYSKSEAVGGSLLDLYQTIGVLQPAAFALIGAGVVASVLARRKDLGVAVAVFGPVFAFSAWAICVGQALFLYRYLFAIVPICSLAVAVTVTALQDRFGDGGRFGMLAFVPLVVVAMVAPIGASRLISEEKSVRSFNRYEVDRTVASYLDNLDTEDGSILADSGTAFAVLLRSERPEKFVITSDSDFRERVADLSTVRYILVPENSGLLEIDAINRRWPSLFDSGPAADSLVEEWPGRDGRPRWRLFRMPDAVAFE
jgi:hypothetical protein